VEVVGWEVVVSEVAVAGAVVVEEELSSSLPQPAPARAPEARIVAASGRQECRERCIVRESTAVGL